MRISDWSSDVCSSYLRPRRSAAEEADDGGQRGHAQELLRFVGGSHPEIISWYDLIVHFDDAQYERLLGFRDGLRRFLRWSDDQAKAAGITPAQHQLLLAVRGHRGQPTRSEEHTSELQSLMRISYAVFCLKKKTQQQH